MQVPSSYALNQSVYSAAPRAHTSVPSPRFPIQASARRTPRSVYHRRLPQLGGNTVTVHRPPHQWIQLRSRQRSIAHSNNAPTAAWAANAVGAGTRGREASVGYGAPSWVAHSTWATLLDRVRPELLRGFPGGRSPGY